MSDACTCFVWLLKAIKLKVTVQFLLYKEKPEQDSTAAISSNMLQRPIIIAQLLHNLHLLTFITDFGDFLLPDATEM